MSDYEVDEVRRVRHQVSEENGHDLQRVAEYYRRVEQELRAGMRLRFADEHDPGSASGASTASNEMS